MSWRDGMSLVSQAVVALMAGESSEKDPFADRSFGRDVGIAGAGPTLAGPDVTAERALRYSAFFGAVSMIANTFARAPLLPYLEHGDAEAGRSDKRRAVGHPLWPVLRRRANRWQTPFALQQMSVVHRMLAGDFVAEVVRGPRGQVVELVPLQPNRLYIHEPESPSQPPAYQVWGPSGVPRTLLRDEVLHVPHLSVTGKKGLSVLEAARDALGTGIAAADHSARFFSQGLLQRFLLSHPKTLTPKGQQFIEEQLEQKKGGKGQGKALILPEDMKLMGISINPNEAQLLEARQFGVLEIARFCNIAPQLLGETSAGMSFASVEQFFDAYLSMTMDGFFEPFEQEAEFTLVDEDGLSLEFLRQALLRADVKTRWMAYSIALTQGVVTRNEVRAFENLPWLPGLDEPLRRRDTMPAGQSQPSAAGGAAQELARLAVLDDDERRVALAEPAERRAAEAGWQGWEGQAADERARRAVARAEETDARRARELAAAAARRLARAEERFLAGVGAAPQESAAGQFYQEWARDLACDLALPESTARLMAEERANDLLEASSAPGFDAARWASGLEHRLVRLALYEGGQAPAA